ncbi:MAG: ABC-2 transporter permease [Oscillospiraceae bacterium]|nr:ABC-2 transporter permease [Oscillospiraceae bacterium]MDE7171778.1 ABC-2 transporter permease [Oscillospiraceae bacterium]
MTGLISKDFIVFKKRFSPLYRLASAALLILAVLLLSGDSAGYIALCLPTMGMAFLTEIVKVDEQSDWKDYLPVLPVTSRDIVLSRYVFSGILLSSVSAVSLAASAVSAAIHGFALAAVVPNYILGVWFGVLMLCVSIPSGYFFKNEICTGAMMWCCLALAPGRSTGIDLKLVRTGSSKVYLMLLLVTAAMLCASYLASLWIYATKRYQKVKMRTAQRA